MIAGGDIYISPTCLWQFESIFLGYIEALQEILVIENTTKAFLVILNHILERKAASGRRWRGRRVQGRLARDQLLHTNHFGT